MGWGEGGKRPDNQASKMRDYLRRVTHNYSINNFYSIIGQKGKGEAAGDRFSEAGKETSGGGGREHIRLRDLQWLYISQCLVKAARQGSGNLIIA